MINPVKMASRETDVAELLPAADRSSDHKTYSIPVSL